MVNLNKIGLGGGCHWCTEGVFQSLIGINKVEQGWIASVDENKELSEAVIIHFNPKLISLKDLIEIHLYTHASTSNHSMRKRYRSAIYTFSNLQMSETLKYLDELQKGFQKNLITKVLPFSSFKLNEESFLNYFYKQPKNAFCTTYIHPKLRLLLDRFSHLTNTEKIDELTLNNI